MRRVRNHSGGSVGPTGGGFPHHFHNHTLPTRKAVVAQLRKMGAKVTRSEDGATVYEGEGVRYCFR